MGFERFSMIAWSDGTKSALNLAVKYPDSVQGIVLFGAEIFNRLSAYEWLNSVIEMKSWGQTKIDCYRRAYDSDQKIQDLWRKYVNFIKFLKLYHGDDILGGRYHLIKCPVLVVLGEKVFTKVLTALLIN